MTLLGASLWGGAHRGIEQCTRFLIQAQEGLIRLFELSSVQLSSTTAKLCRSLLGCDISLGFRHQLISTSACQRCTGTKHLYLLTRLEISSLWHFSARVDRSVCENGWLRSRHECPPEVLDECPCCMEIVFRIDCHIAE